ncbi:transposase family protein [Rufibacter ruber]|nr:transposase family protein [Rufibacter ruber]
MLLAGANKKILYLSQTYEGSVHDKKIADEAEIEFEETIELLQDSGFQGFEPEKANVEMPVKKPKGKELTDGQKQENKRKASQRVVVEHAIGQLKVWRIVKDKIRSCRHKLRDEVMLIACALHNFKIKLNQ